MVRSATAYFNVLKAMDTLEFVRANKVAVERQLEQTQQRFEVGLTAITDVHEAEASATRHWPTRSTPRTSWPTAMRPCAS